MAKRSRRTRRQQAAKQKQSTVSPAIQDEIESIEEEPEISETIEETAIPRKVVNFAREYYYVYTELRNILIVAIIMFVVMVGLAFFV